MPARSRSIERAHHAARDGYAAISRRVMCFASAREPSRTPSPSQNFSRLGSWLVSALCALVAATVAHATPPTAAYIFPAGGQRGTTVEFRVGGHEMHATSEFAMIGAGVQSTSPLRRAAATIWFEGPLVPLPGSQAQENYPKDLSGSVVIDADAAPGIRRWRVWNSEGATASLPFVVGDLPEVIEDELDGEPVPTAVAVPVTINGRIFPREDVDVWSFECLAGVSYTCEVMAARIGSPLDSELEVLGPDGQALASNGDARGADSLVRFTAAVSGKHVVRIHDVAFGGLQPYVYRLTITDGPLVDYVYPLGGRRGAEVRLEIRGQKTPAEPAVMKMPQDGGASILQRIEWGGSRFSAVELRLGDAPEVLESEPNARPEQALAVQAPIVVNGRIDSPGDEDAWRLEAKKGDQLLLDLFAARLGSPLDSVLAISDAAGKELAMSDDLDGTQTDSRLTFSVPEDGTYVARVRDRFRSRGGPAFAYRLEIGPAAPMAPDFELQLAADAITVPRGASGKLKVSTTRQGGFAEAIALEVVGLPTGVTVEGAQIEKGKNDAELTFKADSRAKVAAGQVTIRGVAMIGQSSVSRSAMKRAAGRDDIDVDHLLVAVAMPAPFKFRGDYQSTYVDRGATFVKHFTIERGGYDGPLSVQLADRQVRHLQGVTGPTISVPAGANEFEYPVHLAPWMEVGRTSRTCLMIVGEVPDEDGRKHSVSFTSHEQNDQIIALVDPGRLELVVEPATIPLVPRETTRIRVRVARAQSLAGLPVRVEWVGSPRVPGATSDPIMLDPGHASGEISFAFAPLASGELPDVRSLPLVFRATAMPEGRPLTAEASIEVVVPRRP